MRSGRLAKIVLAAVFVALLATPLVRKRWAAHREDGKLKLEASQALTRYGLHFQEVAQASGISFVHQAPTLDHKLNHIMPQVASMGAGASVVDFDRDGWQDIYLTNSGEGSKNSLYRNMGDGGFKDVAGTGHRGCQSSGHWRLDGRGLGRLQQRWLRRSFPVQMGTPGTLSQ